MRIVVGRADSFGDPGRKVVAVDGAEVGVFHRNGAFTAFENVCPHIGGPVCQGKIIPRVSERIAADKTSLGFAFSEDHLNIVCPWHGYEFDIESGAHQGNPRLRLRPVPVEVIAGEVVITLPQGARERIARARSAPESPAR